MEAGLEFFALESEAAVSSRARLTVRRQTGEKLTLTAYDEIHAGEKRACQKQSCTRRWEASVGSGSNRSNRD